MRFNQPNDLSGGSMPSAGVLLVAHPSMLDSNFCKAVVFLTVHNPAEGALGVVVNRPLNKTLGEYDPEWSISVLSEVELYEGGPVAPDKLTLAAWKWVPAEGTFRLYFGIDGEKAMDILDDDPSFQIRGFMGHSGWSEGQLEEEIDDGAWILSDWLPGLENKTDVEVWRSILCHENPAMRLLADMPDDPSLN